MIPVQAIQVEARTRPLPTVDARALLAGALGRPRMAVNERGHAFVAIGAAATWTARGPTRFHDIRRWTRPVLAAAHHATEGEVPEGLGPRVVGGAAFDRDHAAGGAWAGFDSARFWLPEQTVTWIDGHAYETTVTVAGAPPASPGRDVPDTRLEAQDEAAWTETAGRALATLDRLDMEKLVLARCAAGPPSDADAAFAALSGLEPGTTRFLVDPIGAGAFIGATPERLLDVQDGHVATHALAGSAPTGPSADEHGRSLLASAKDQREHALVLRHIRQVLDHAGVKGIETGAQVLRRLRTVQHIETPVTGTTRAHVLDLVDAIHPTPAVAGAPPLAAMRALRALEPFSRGWYGGLVGWYDGHGNGRFAVPLRCALMHDEGTWRFAGAGLVRGSDPAREWHETELKLAAMRPVTA